MSLGFDYSDCHRAASRDTVTAAVSLAIATGVVMTDRTSNIKELVLRAAHLVIKWMVTLAVLLTALGDATYLAIAAPELKCKIDYIEKLVLVNSTAPL
ncbi:unnamed protein product [Parnassius apollo]|uniref:(apollo) hypothetical protein n=1 Tax=Parnassius apollo TaxID=110799 RepID=A0A8S3YA61_PARAO|nr:unnamed protein product [Parnassius apollo]